MNALETRTDADLLAATPTDADAFAVFYRRHVHAVLAYVARRAPAADVGDLVSEVFATALVHRRRFDPEIGTGRAWLIGIAHHKIADAQRRGAVTMKLYRRLGALATCVGQGPYTLEQTTTRGVHLKPIPVGAVGAFKPVSCPELHLAIP